MPTSADSCVSVKSEAPIFANYAASMRRAGFAVLPADGKKPLRVGFNKWRYAPGEKVVGEWAAKTPNADIVIVPGLSRHRLGGDRLIIVDGDDAKACDDCAERGLADTPGKVKTRRGMHFYFRYDGPDLGKLSSLRKFGFNIDIKHGQRGAGIVAAPPSRHEKDRSSAYAWDGCDETVIRDLPKFNIKALEAITNRGGVVPTGTQFELKARPVSKRARANYSSTAISRGAGLHEFELIALGQNWNERLPLGIDKLEDSRVMQIAQGVWKDYQSGKLQGWHGRPSVARSTHHEVQDLLRRGKFGPFAVAMLLTLRTAHEGRCARGETFSITPKAMAMAGTLPGYSRETIEKCRDMLLDAGFIELVAPMINGKTRKAAAYRLRPRAI